VNIVDCGLNAELISKAYNYNHPISFISGTRHDGTMPAINGFLSLEEGNVAISAVKMPEDFSPGKVILRMYETEGRSTKAVLRFAQKIKRAELLDINENVIDDGETHVHVNGERVEIDISAHKVVTCCIEF
jgi:alpha-mannosidase